MLATMACDGNTLVPCGSRIASAIAGVYFPSGRSWSLTSTALSLSLPYAEEICVNAGTPSISVILPLTSSRSNRPTVPK